MHKYDVLAKSRVFGVPTFFFFLTWITTFFKWTNVIKIVAQRYEKILTDEDVNNMDWNTRVQYLKRNPISVTR